LIEVTFSEQCESEIRQLEIPHARVTEAVSDRHLGLVTEGPGRLIALRWPPTGHLTLVDAKVTRSEREGTSVTILEVMADLVVELVPDLPGGRLTPEMTLDDVLRVVGRSFGYPITCSPQGGPDHPYTGPWDGEVRIDFQDRSETGGSVHGRHVHARHGRM
jgi:hypothetical protein